MNSTTGVDFTADCIFALASSEMKRRASASLEDEKAGAAAEVRRLDES